MGSSMPQVSSAPQLEDSLVVGGGDAYVVGDVDYEYLVDNAGDVYVADLDSIASHKAEILTGTDALRFLYSNSGTSKQSCTMKSLTFSKLFSEMSSRESTVSTLENSLPTISVLASSRKQRKAYRPSRVRPLDEEVEPLPPKKKQSVVLDNLVSSKPHNHKIRKKNGFSDSKAAKKKAEILLMEKCKRNKQEDTPQNASVVCKNLACKAVLHAGASFCRRCSCCLCKKFDDNKDPSLWITCDLEDEGCGLSCHVECALQNGVAGVIRKRGSGSLDGSFSCKSCGKISSLIGLWRRQLLIAKGARRVDVLCHRLFLSHRLLQGTLKYKDSHTLLDNAVKKLEAEVCLMNMGSAKLERCIVNRLACNTEVQEMVDLALERAETLGDAQSAVLDADDSVHNNTSDNILGYKLWHRKATDPSYPATPTYTIQNTSQKILVSNLDACTSYVFKITPFSSRGDREGYEAEYCTEGMDSTVVENQEDSFIESQCIQKGRPDMHGGLIDDLSGAKSPLVTQVEEGKAECFMKDTSNAHIRHPFAIQRLATSEMDGFCNGVTSTGELEKGKEELFVSRDTKAVNGDVTDDDNIGSQSWALQLHSHDAQRVLQTKGIASYRQDGFSHGSCNADFHCSELSIRVIRWLECQGHLDKEFRMKFLTWYSIRATEHEKRVVSIFIDTLRDSPASLAAQLVDAFQETINSKRQRATELEYYNKPYH